MEQLYRQYLRLVRGQAARLLSHGPEVDDVVQEVFLKYWQKYSGTRQDDPAALLFRMANNAALSVLRSRRRRLDRETGATPDSPTTSMPDMPLELHSLLAVAEPADAEAAALYHIGELTQDEISAVLGITRYEVMTRLERFAKRLRREASTNAWYQEEPHALEA